MATLLEQLQAKGAKVYASSPLWISTEKIQTITVSENAVVVEGSGEYAGTYSLVIQEDGERAYIPLAKNTSPNQEEFSLEVFTAQRDWEKWDISKGDTKVFAV